MPETDAFSDTLPDGTLLAFDFGEKRIGVAVGESALAQAHPLTTIRSAAKVERFTAIAALIAEWRPAGLVVGLPVAYAEERFSSIEAEERLHASGHDARSARAHIDAIAAQIILQNHFARQLPPPGSATIKDTVLP